MRWEKSDRRSLTMSERLQQSVGPEQQLEIPAEKARQGITGVHLRHVLAVSFVGAVVALGVVYALVV